MKLIYGTTVPVPEEKGRPARPGKCISVDIQKMKTTDGFLK